MSFLEGVLGKIAEEHGIDEEKMKQIHQLVDKVDAADIADIAGKVGIPETAVEKIITHLKK